LPLGVAAIVGASCVRLEATEATLGGVGTDGGSQSCALTSSSGSSAVDPGGHVTTAPDGGTVCGAAAATDPWSPGYQVTSCVTANATSVVDQLQINQQADMMRGTHSGCGGSMNYNDIFESGGTTGLGFMAAEGTVRELTFRDGPRGVCLVPYSNAPKDNNQFPKGDYSTTFPSASARGASFDLGLEQAIGAAIGDEMVAAGTTVLLAPVINILRHPAWGRSQETYGEDSYALGRLGTAFVSGAQQYVQACVKHFEAYNIENGRDSGNVAVMDEQTAYESYGRHFEMVIQDGGVACVMAAYNQIQIAGGQRANCTSNGDLLTKMLRDTFGFKGYVMSDWWALPGGQGCPGTSNAAQKQNAADAVNAGLDLEMPWSLNYSQLESDVPSLIQNTQIATSAQRIATQQYRFNAAVGNSDGLKPAQSTFNRSNFSIDDTTSTGQAHVALAYKAAVESMVLLKNSSNTLPIPSSVKTLGVIGANVPYALSSSADIQTGTVHFASDVRTGDLGSSRTYTDPATSTSPLQGFQKAAADKGMTVVTGTDATAPAADFYVIIAGMTPQDEGEGYTSADASGGDRPSFDLDSKITPVQDQLIQQIAARGKPTVVVLEGGSVINVDTPGISAAQAVVMAWYPGQDGGHAMADLLFGNANFSGKLPVSWANYGDEPQFVGPNKVTTMDYYVGYKYLDNRNITPVFPFGYGLSYTTFAYSNLSVPCESAGTDGLVNVQVQVQNTGSVDGDEVSFLFVSYPNTAQRRPAKELKGFQRTTIGAGNSATVTFPLRMQDLKYWDSTSHSWKWENGPVQILVGGSSGNLPLTSTINVAN
jgi:beta-glucosidase